ncbi:MAG TPA: DUF934 domain-containing protein [Rhodocyclaceae bacterium]|nr:DUF934 domain-containing protein [Rhodocyclaceae bacterium]
MPKLIKERRVEDDAWKVVTLAKNETPTTVRLPVGPLLVPVAVWHARRLDLVAREYEHGDPLGVWLAPNEGPETIAEDLGDFTVVAVHFNKLADGRGYSTARLLRERYGYKGELRAFGDIGRDQIFYLNRVGFDSFQLGEGKSAEEALAALDEIPVAYQGAADDALPLFRRRA